MTDPLTTAQTAAVEKEDARIKICLEIVNSDATNPFTWRFCSGGYGCAHDGDHYLARAMKVSGSGRGDISIAKMNVVLDNRDDALGEQICTTGSLNGSICTAVMLTNVGGVYKDPITLISAGIVRSVPGYDLSFEVSMLYGKRRRAASLKGSRTCGHVFGGDVCGYTKSSGDRCSKTYAACVAYSNEDRFGGDRFAPNPGDVIQCGGEGYIKVKDSRYTWYKPSPWAPAGRSYDVGELPAILAPSEIGMTTIVEDAFE